MHKSGVTQDETFILNESFLDSSKCAKTTDISIAVQYEWHNKPHRLVIICVMCA